MLRNKRVLVTGASGFVGRHLVDRLLREGAKVTCLIKPGDTFSDSPLGSVRPVVGNINDIGVLTDTARGMEYVFHLAAVLGGNDPESFYRVNYEGTRLLAEACRQTRGLKRLLYVSSTAVTGPSGPRTILDEKAACQPITDYGRSKLKAEKHLKKLYRESDFPVTIVRLPLVYGPGSFGGLYIYFKLINKGIFLDFGQGRTSVCFVRDAVDGMIRAAENPNTQGKTYILGESDPYTILSIRDHIAGVLNKRPLRILTPSWLLMGVAILFELHGKITGKIPALTRNEVASYTHHPYWCFDSRRASEDFDFNIRYPLQKGLKITADWYSSKGLI